MKVLILYLTFNEPLRLTIDQHLFSFQRYIYDVEFIYHDVNHPLPSNISTIKFDGVVLHYTLLSIKYNYKLWKKLSGYLRFLKENQAVKVAIPQDEYWFSERLCQLFKDIRLDAIFTCVLPEYYHVLYPKHLCEVEYIETVFTGYVDEDLLQKIEKQVYFFDIKMPEKGKCQCTNHD